MRIINGTDIVERKRIRKILHRFGKRFMEKILSEKELKILIKFSKNNELLSEKLSNRFAAKEAAAKALGTGFTNGVRLSDLEIINDKLGKPNLYFLGRSKTLLKKVKSDYRNHGVTLSISSEKEYSVAFVSIYFFNA